jgi:penicillin-binding protein 2
MAAMQYDDRRSVSLRLSGMQFLIAAVFAMLAVAFWIFQVAQHQKFAEMAENNHLRTLPVRAPRGVLFDRTGKVLVENRYSYTIALVREQTANLDQTIRTLAAATGLEEEAVREIVRRRRSEPSYRPINIVEDASLAQVAAVRARGYELPGVVIDEVPTRHYPDDDVAAHLFGYVGEISESQLQRASNEKLQSGAIVGQAGIEQIYNSLLMGTDGSKYVVVNSTGREIRAVGEEQPVEGRRLQLTIDYDVQRAVEEGFRKSGYNGAAVILDPRNGEILSLVSLPAYDPNRFATGIDRATWASLNTDKLHPLQNRALQGRYSPGSTFKIAVATAALQEGVITPDFKVTCSGGATFYGRYFQCWKKGGHGTVDLRHAIEQSCNVYFYTVGNMVGVDRLHKWAALLGLGEKTGVDLPHEVQGLVPSTEWKRRVMKEKWYAGETISVSIGQGQVSVTPIEMAVMMATVGNGGTRYTPHLLKAVDKGHGWEPVPAPPVLSSAQLKPATISAVHDGLWMVVNGAGTGGRARIPGKDVSGKTGTAQVISLQGAKAAAGRTDMDLRHNGWFVFFAPRDNPEIAGVVFTEHSMHGAESAPIAKFAMETFFAKKEGRPLPEWPVKPGAAGVVAAAAAAAEEPDAVPAVPIRIP